jgi:hypothetical protein
VRTDDQYRRILRVEQESLYGPDELEEFTLGTATAELADHARIVPPLTNTGPLCASAPACTPT